MSLILVIDQGTHATRALVIDEEGRIRTSSFCGVSLQRLGPDRVEQDAEEIAASVAYVVKDVLASEKIRGLPVVAAGMATQRSSVVAWDRETGKPLAPMLSWQDRRAADLLRNLSASAGRIREITGLPLSPHYGGSKLRWYLEHVPEVRRALYAGRLALGPLASFLLFRMLQGQPLVVDHANASRTQLWNLARRGWDPWLLNLFAIPRETLPECKPIACDYGTVLGTGIPMKAVNGDQNAAIYSLGRPRHGTAIVNLGTGAFILVPLGDGLIRHPRLLSSLASSGLDWNEYTIEGTVNGAGAALSWAEEHWSIPDITLHLPGWLEQVMEPPVFLNTIGGLGSPWWKPGPAPVLVGDGTPEERAVAVVESILFMLQANLEEMENAGVKVDRIQISGGLSQLSDLCQRLADLTGLTVYRPPETEATARGAAWIAAGRPRHWPKQGRGRVFHPHPDDALTARYCRFRHLIESN